MGQRGEKRVLAKLCGLVLLCACASLLLAGCGQSQNGYTYSEGHKIIIDTDTAADDALAVVMAAKAPNIELLGVTTLAGNVSLEQGSKNALQSLEVAGRDDVAVYPGSTTKFSGVEITPFSVFGDDGMGDQGLIDPKGSVQDKDAVDFIIETVKANPDEVEIVMLGPATNIAKAIEKDPETMKHVKRIWSMGTGGTGCKGNASPVAEYNVYQDIDAYQYVLGKH